MHSHGCDKRNKKTLNRWEAGDYIIRYGTEGGHMYLVVSGEVEVIGRQDDQDTVVCTFGAGDNFGELEFLNDHKCVADVRAVTKCKTARINRAHFELCLGPVKGYLRDSTRSSTYDYYRQKTEVEN
ncbi:cAMP-dependent protein kinase regulatory subunit [Diplonema papillatum]|nr:cAMP-dependent protein kinase regulatory subunit [Diplonema papillatum]